MSEPMKFGVFDPMAEVDISSRYLPHWFQSGVAVFITFRTADSLPKAVLKLWEREQFDWLQRNVPDLINSHTLRIGETGAEKILASIPERLRRDFQQLRWQSWHGHLDTCHGDCLLRRRDLAKIVGDSVRHFDGSRYDLESFVVMPNHVHVLAQFRPGFDLRKQCGEWQRFSARAINAALGRRGRFWQPEPFDHLVRSAEQFEYLRNYVAENPAKARLPQGDFLYWRHAL